MEKLVTAIVSKNDNSKEYLKLSSEKHVCELREFDQDKYKNDIVISKPMYEITSIFTKEDSLQKSLTIFINDEKKYYYKFFYNKLGKYFYCSKCLLLKFPLTAVIKNHGRENECVYMSHQKHICDPLEYFGLTNGNLIQAPKYQLIKRKNRGKIFQHLVVFTNDERSECFEYTLNEIKNNFVCYACNNRHKWFVCAKIVYNAAEEECLQLSERLHKCKPIKFVPENISTKIIKLPNYQLLNRKANGKMFQHLAVFTNDEKNECFEYTWNESEKKFVCNSCKYHKIHVTAKIIKNDESEECVEFGKTEHLCQPKQFIPENADRKIVKLPNFKLWQIQSRKKTMKKLTVFDSKNRNYGYVYTYFRKLNCYMCNRCRGKQVTAKIFQDENGENYVELNKIEHICEMKKL